MKKKLVLASKAALGVFLFSLLGICMIGAYATEGKTSALSAFGLILFVIAMAVSGYMKATTENVDVQRQIDYNKNCINFT